MNNQIRNRLYATIIIILAVIILFLSIISVILSDDKMFVAPPTTVIFVVIGIALIVAGIIKLMYTKNRCSYKVRATCIDLGEHKSYDSESDSYTIQYYPIYEFNYNYENLKVTSSFSSSRNVYVGEQVELLINPRKPKEFIYADGQKSVHKTLITAGMLFIIIGIMYNIVY
mgnify:CR=1 FL=1